MGPMRAVCAPMLLAAAVAAGPAVAETYSVLEDGTGDFDNLTAALGAVLPGDVIELGAGTFSPLTTGETLPLEMPPGVTLAGAGAGKTILDGQYHEALVYVRWSEEEEVRLEDLSLIRGECPRDGEPAVLYVWQSTVALAGVAIEDNGDPDIPYKPWNPDMWIDVRSSTLTMRDVVWQGNFASSRGLTCGEAEVVLEQVTLHDNHAYYGMVDLRDQCTGSVDGLSLTENAVANCDGALLAAGAAPVANLLAVGNDVGPCRLVLGTELVHATIADTDSQGFFPLLEVERLGHSIVAFNDAPVALVGEQRAVSNDVFDNQPADWDGPDPTGSDGNVSQDPRFVGGPTEPEIDLALAPDSPLIDAGGDELTAATDVLGGPRPLDGNGDGVAEPDPGAFEAAEDSYDPGDDDDSAGDDDDDGCECHVAGPRGPGAAVLVGLVAAAAARRRGARRGD